MQLYDNVLRVPFLIRGPGILPGTQLDIIASMVDLTPTFVQLAGGPAPSDTDGRSFAPFLLPKALPKPTKPWKTTHLTTYQSIKTAECLWNGTARDPEAPSNLCGRHPVDAAGNTHTSIRIMNASHNLLYGEFTDVNDPDGWDFSLPSIEFFALFDLNVDPFQLHNIYHSSPLPTQQVLHAELRRANTCRGQADGAANPCA